MQVRDEGRALRADRRKPVTTAHLLDEAHDPDPDLPRAAGPAGSGRNRPWQQELGVPGCVVLGDSAEPRAIPVVTDLVLVQHHTIAHGTGQRHGELVGDAAFTFEIHDDANRIGVHAQRIAW